VKDDNKSTTRTVKPTTAKERAQLLLALPVSLECVDIAAQFTSGLLELGFSVNFRSAQAGWRTYRHFKYQFKDSFNSFTDRLMSPFGVILTFDPTKTPWDRQRSAKDVDRLRFFNRCDEVEKCANAIGGNGQSQRPVRMVFRRPDLETKYQATSCACFCTQVDASSLLSPVHATGCLPTSCCRSRWAASSLPRRCGAADTSHTYR
jgi:hypothetical protein